jgi:hypothetical protein
MQVLPIIRAVPMLAASPYEILDSQSGDIDPNTQVDTGLGREFDFNDEWSF